MDNKLILFTVLLCVVLVFCQKKYIEGFDLSLSVLKTYSNIPNAYKGVAIGQSHFYAIDSLSISKHDLITGNLIKSYTFVNHPRIKNLMSGIVVGNRLYVCNNPTELTNCQYNTLEIFDLDLNHKYFVEITGNTGELIGVDYFRNTWWACFAHDGDEAKYTVLCEMYHPRPVTYSDEDLDNRMDYKSGLSDDIKERDTIPIQKTCQTEPLQEKDLTRWHIRNRYFFPDVAINAFKDKSVNGFSFGPDGLVYVTNNTQRIFVMYLAYSSSVMQLEKIVNVSTKIRGVDWDKSRKLLMGVNKDRNEVVMYDAL